MRRRATAAVALPVSMVLFAATGCGALDESLKPWFMRSDSEYPSGLPTVSGEVGEEPNVEFPGEEPPEEPLTGIAVEGPEEDQGDLVRSGDAIVSQMVSYEWSGQGETQELSSTYDDDTPLAVSLQPGPQVADLIECVTDATVGSRVVCAFPPDPEQMGADPAMQQMATQVIILDIEQHYPQGSTVTAEQTEDGGGDLPTVTEVDGEQPEISIPDEDPPEELETVVLAEGDGPEVEADEQLITQYTGMTWDDGEVFDSTWMPGRNGTPQEFQVADGAVIDGWVDGLVGQNVGDRVMLVIPPDLAYGEDEDAAGGQPSGTLVFVVDILGSAPPVPEQEMPEPDMEDMEGMEGMEGMEDLDLEDLDLEGMEE
ncbi:FKBP-type peptidyl-prolyl cis-trans isomerase [Lipingzhangella sp. LS1_29]|uniref:peptidylprolyl isomerase n=1 Tax=Lipingzhangella rawalii TaxID=2055835 RepID=A0ABU2H0X8_9ACTN|nr:FKBP-type peptidyl-prolyl cis-trans isomerase [Lipingzhangella rawalii]MDS1268946.1 FKBP-type peptidyl-prolyl cis-trans isomerase [Lipingzhangella rawalii]